MKEIQFNYFSDVHDQTPKNYGTKTKKDCYVTQNITTQQNVSGTWSPEFDDIFGWILTDTQSLTAVGLL